MPVLNQKTTWINIVFGLAECITITPSGHQKLCINVYKLYEITKKSFRVVIYIIILIILRYTVDVLTRSFSRILPCGLWTLESPCSGWGHVGPGNCPAVHDALRFNMAQVDWCALCIATLTFLVGPIYLYTFNEKATFKLSMETDLDMQLISIPFLCVFRCVTFILLNFHWRFPRTPAFACHCHCTTVLVWWWEVWWRQYSAPPLCIPHCPSKQNPHCKQSMMKGGHCWGNHDYFTFLSDYDLSDSLWRSEKYSWLKWQSRYPR